MSQDSAKLYDWLTRTHQKWGWSQRKLTEACQMSPNGFRAYRDGVQPQRGRLGAIASGVGVTVDDLYAVMDGQDVPIPARPPTPRPKASRSLEGQVEYLAQQVESLSALMLRHLRDHATPDDREGRR